MNYNYLNDDIYVRIPITINESKNFEYYISRYLRVDMDDSGNDSFVEFFNGTVFVEKPNDKTTTTVTIYLNDVIATRKVVSTSIIAENGVMAGDVAATGNGTIIPNEDNYNIFEIRIKDDSGAWQSAYVYVMLQNRYPAMTQETDIYNVHTMVASRNDIARVDMFREGYDCNTGKSVLMPKIALTSPYYFGFGNFIYPTRKYLENKGNKLTYKIVNDKGNVLKTTNMTTKYPYSQYVFRNDWMANLGSFTDNDKLYLVYSGTKEEHMYTVYASGVSTHTDAKLFLIQTGCWTEQECEEKATQLVAGQEVTVYQSPIESECEKWYLKATQVFNDAGRDEYTTYVDNDFTIAEIEQCPARYYLVWYDRMGGMQSQPFRGINIYSEDIANVLIQNQYMKKRIGSGQTTPKWKLVSGWLKEDEYQIYESMFVSPYVTLVDTQNQKAFSVLITDTSYTEKTYKNQNKQLCNFTVNVKLNKEDRMYY